MQKFFQKNKIHLIIWVIMLAYLVAAPDLYSHFILKNGKPVRFSQQLPKTTDQIKYSVDRLDPVMVDGQELYYLWGWSFYLADKDQSNYEQFIVLKSDTRTYYFPLKPFKRPELQTAFKNVKIDLRNSGFSTYLSIDTIQPDDYKIGILYRQKSSSDLKYRITNRLLNVTSNKIELTFAENLSGSKPSATPGNNNSGASLKIGDGKPAQFGQELPAPGNQIRYSVDRLDQVSSDSQKLYYLWGWSFYPQDADQTKYEQFVVLKSHDNVYIFTANAFQRPDLQSAFKDIKIDLSNSGFGAYLSQPAIKPGTYDIGILYRNKTSSILYYVITNKAVTVTGDKIELVVSQGFKKVEPTSQVESGSEIGIK
jgi:hypothetical protein